MLRRFAGILNILKSIKAKLNASGITKDSNKCYSQIQNESKKYNNYKNNSAYNIMRNCMHSVIYQFSFADKKEQA